MWQSARLAEPSSGFQPEPKFSLSFKTFMFILQYNIKFTPQTSYFWQILLNICCWNHNAMASTKQKDEVTTQVKGCANTCILEVYSASLSPIESPPVGVLCPSVMSCDNQNRWCVVILHVFLQDESAVCSIVFEPLHVSSFWVVLELHHVSSLLGCVWDVLCQHWFVVCSRWRQPCYNQSKSQSSSVSLQLAPDDATDSLAHRPPQANHHSQEIKQHHYSGIECQSYCPSVTSMYTCKDQNNLVPAFSY